MTYKSSLKAVFVFCHNEGEEILMRKKTKKVVIKEELVKLTGDYKLAIVLNQMIYWSERIADFDEFIKEEQDAFNKEVIDQEYQYGWIYKSALELSDECMITNSETTMRRYLTKLVETGYLYERKNPKFRWDKTMQYRLNVKKLQIDLHQIGFELEGYRKSISFGFVPTNGVVFQSESDIVQSEGSIVQHENAIPEITTESTSISFKEEKAIREANTPYTFFEQNGFGTIGSYISEKISAWCTDLSDELVIKAMELAVERGAKSFSYVETILRDWTDKKLKSMKEVEAYLLQYRENKRKQNNKGHSKKIVRKEIIPAYITKLDYQQKEEISVEELQNTEEKKQELERRIAALRNRRNCEFAIDTNHSPSTAKRVVGITS